MRPENHPTQAELSVSRRRFLSSKAASATERAAPYSRLLGKRSNTIGCQEFSGYFSGEAHQSTWQANAHGAVSRACIAVKEAQGGTRGPLYLDAPEGDGDGCRPQCPPRKSVREVGVEEWIEGL